MARHLVKTKGLGSKQPELMMKGNRIGGESALPWMSPNTVANPCRQTTIIFGLGNDAEKLHAPAI